MPESAVDRLRGTGKWTKQCSFCQKSQSQVARLIPGLHDTYICNECVALYYRLLQELEASQAANKTPGTGS
ncbi:MAG: ClpX C4-type zinc finger protein [Anaerolineae bacterium]